MATGHARSVAPMTAGVAVSDVERTGRDTTVAQWGVAVVVMVGSAASAGIGFAHLDEHWAIGVITGLGVDLALASGLIIGRRLRAVGITTYWNTVLLWLTGAMTLCLNSGAAALTGQWVLAVAHAFLPVLLVVLCEAGSEAQLKLLRLRQQREAAEQAERDAQLAAERSTYEAHQRRIAAERQQDTERAERDRAERIRIAELAAAEHERETADRRAEREHRDRHLVASLASVMALGAAWRRRPQRPSQARPRRSPAGRPRRAPRSVPTSVPVTEELVSQARRVRAMRATQGKSAGRAVLQRELGIPETTARELVRRLGQQPLHALPGGGR